MTYSLVERGKLETLLAVRHIEYRVAMAQGRAAGRSASANQRIKLKAAEKVVLLKMLVENRIWETNLAAAEQIRKDVVKRCLEDSQRVAQLRPAVLDKLCPKFLANLEAEAKNIRQKDQCILKQWKYATEEERQLGPELLDGASRDPEAPVLIPISHLYREENSLGFTPPEEASGHGWTEIVMDVYMSDGSDPESFQAITGATPEGVKCITLSEDKRDLFQICVVLDGQYRHRVHTTEGSAGDAEARASQGRSAKRTKAAAATAAHVKRRKRLERDAARRANVLESRARFADSVRSSTLSLQSANAQAISVIALAMAKKYDVDVPPGALSAPVITPPVLPQGLEIVQVAADSDDDDGIAEDRPDDGGSDVEASGHSIAGNSGDDGTQSD